MQIEWRKEGNLLVPSSNLVISSATHSGEVKQQGTPKYSEVAYITNLTGTGEQVMRQRHSNLVLTNSAQNPPKSDLSTLLDPRVSVKSIELMINFADRGDTGTYVCIGRNMYGSDELTYRLVVQEVPDVPLDVTAHQIKSTSLKLSWVNPFDGNLPLTHFIVEHRKVGPNGQQHYQSSSAHGEWVRMMVSLSKLQQEDLGDNLMGSTSQTSYTLALGGRNSSSSSSGLSSSYSWILRQLSPRSTYHLRVAAVNAIGQGGFSSHVSVTTAEEPPNIAASDLRSQPMSSNSIKVVWRAPSLVEDHAPIKGYQVSHRRMQQVGSGQESSITSSSTSSQNNELWLATASVSAASNQSSQAINGEGGLRNVNYEYLLPGLDKNTKYEIRVQPYNSMGVGPASHTVGQTLKFDRPGQPDLKFLGAKHHSFELKWSMSDQEPLMGFSIFYKCEYDDWQEIQLGIIFHYIIDNLRCGNKYQIYLSAFNAVGRSDPSDVLSVRTEGSAPIAPDKSRFFKSNRTEVILDMSGWQSGGCPINSFMIQFKKLHETNWYILSEGSTPFASSDKITIPDLSPATWYKLLVTALNEAGSTNAEYLFSTLTLAGEQIAPAYPSDLQAGGVTGWRHSAGSAGTGSFFTAFSQLLNMGTPAQQNGQDAGQLLLTLSCILLLLVTTLASYLYYSRSRNQGSGGSQTGSTNSATSSSSDRSSSAMTSGHVHDLTSRTLGRAYTSCHRQGYNTVGMSSSATLGRQPASSTKLPASYFEQHNQSQNIESGDDSQHQMLIQHLMSGGGAKSQDQSSPTGSPLAGSHCMKLLANSAQIFGAASNSSNVSTHSTNLFDNSSSAASTSAASGPTSIRPKLELIDEKQQQQQRSNLYCSHNNSGSPMRARVYAPVNAISPQRVDSLQNGTGTQQELDESLINEFYNRPGVQEFQAGTHRMHSVSFQSANELLQRQQLFNTFNNRTQESHLEPIYQRLDKFQALGPAKYQSGCASVKAQDAESQASLCPITINQNVFDLQQAKGVNSRQVDPVMASSSPSDIQQQQQQAQYYFYQPAPEAAIFETRTQAPDGPCAQPDILFPSQVN